MADMPRPLDEMNTGSPPPDVEPCPACGSYALGLNLQRGLQERATLRTQLAAAQEAHRGAEYIEGCALADAEQLRERCNQLEAHVAALAQALQDCAPQEFQTTGLCWCTDDGNEGVCHRRPRCLRIKALLNAPDIAALIHRQQRVIAALERIQDRAESGFDRAKGEAEAQEWYFVLDDAVDALRALDAGRAEK
jgi:chromosome segregation ATPase